jgi:hypothetical protein
VETCRHDYPFGDSKTAGSLCFIEISERGLQIERRVRLIPLDGKEVPMAVAGHAIDAREAHAKLELDPGAMLVCAYEDRKKFEQYHLDEAIPFDEFKAKESSLPKDTEIIFYCA